MTKLNEHIFRELVSYTNYGVDKDGEPREALGDVVDEWGCYFCSNVKCKADNLGDDWAIAREHKCDE